MLLKRFSDGCEAYLVRYRYVVLTKECRELGRLLSGDNSAASKLPRSQQRSVLLQAARKFQMCDENKKMNEGCRKMIRIMHAQISLKSLPLLEPFLNMVLYYNSHFLPGTSDCEQVGK